MTDARHQIREFCRRVEAGEFPLDSMMDKLAAFWKWVNAGFSRIRDVHGEIIRMHANDAQAMLHAAMMRQAAAGRPVRIVVLKGRKRGVSTWVQAFGVFLVAHWPNQQCKTLAHVTEATQEIFGIAKQVSREYESVVPLNPIQNRISHPTNGSWYHCYTAGGEGVGAGGTPTLLHRSELAFWGTNKAETDRSSGDSVPYVPSTVIIDESTANGRDLFYQRFCDAADPDHPFDRVFIAWYVNEDCEVPIDGEFVLDDAEKTIIRRAHKDGIEVSNEALNWRRMKIREIGEGAFRQDYPSTPEEAVQGSRGLIVTGVRDCLVADLPFDPTRTTNAQRVGGIDFGYNDPTVIWTGFYIDRVLWLIDYYRASESIADQWVAGIREGHTYYCDPAEVTDRQHLQLAAKRAGKRCTFLSAPRQKFPGEDPSVTEIKLLVELIRKDRFRVNVKAAAQLVVECDTLAWNEKTGKIDDRRTDECGHYDSIKGATYAVMGVLYGDSFKASPRREHVPSRSQMMRAV